MAKKIFVNGTFDILHVGHLRLLSYAKSLGDILHVSIDSDNRVKSLKGINRPFNNEVLRREFLLELKSVDIVSVFSSDQALEELIQRYSPDVMVVGSDYRDKNVIGSQFSKSLVFYERIEPLSTTRTIQYITGR